MTNKKFGLVLFQVFVFLVIFNLLYEVTRYYVDSTFLLKDVISKSVIQGVALIVAWIRLTTKTK